MTMIFTTQTLYKSIWHFLQRKCCLHNASLCDCNCFELCHRLRRVLADLEVGLPSAELGILRHQLVHMYIADALSVSGPAWTSAMWTFERLWESFKKTCNWMKQTRQPETVIMNAYRAIQAGLSRCQHIAIQDNILQIEQ
jgi:hypothetical protein